MEGWRQEQEALQEVLAAETRRRAEAEAHVQEISLYNSAILEQAQVRPPPAKAPSLYSCTLYTR